MQKMNSQTMKQNNVETVFDAIAANAPVSRSSLTKIIGLTPATITNLVNEMLERGILLEVGREKNDGLGRRPVLIDVNPDAFFTVGAEINADRTVAIVCDAKSTIRTVYSRSISPVLGKDTILHCLATTIRRAIEQAGVSESDILGIGVAAPGPLDTQTGVMINPPNFPGWKNVPLKDWLENEMKLPVCCDKETNLAALAEYHAINNAEVKTLFAMNLYKLGVGGGLVCSGNIFHGFHDSASEVGHMTVDMNGPRCSCGNYGCLETLVSGEAIVNEVKRNLKTLSALSRDRAENVDELTIEDVLLLSEQGDELCSSIVDKAARNIAVAVGNVINMYSPEVIVLGGTLAGLSKGLVRKVADYAHCRDYPVHCKDIKICCTTLGDKACALGAASMAAEIFLNKTLSGSKSE